MFFYVKFMEEYNKNFEQQIRKDFSYFLGGYGKGV